ncbi:unnamed protein product [Brugia timori]|uniref:Uncharacterized protein n=1 Tax=Brugia timori TaxID=42155 RepID=A0A0R3R560_9BILA|nr:unnamed protein product [Brugia timori]
MVGIGDLSRGFIREICESNTGEERPVIQVLVNYFIYQFFVVLVILISVSFVVYVKWQCFPLYKIIVIELKKKKIFLQEARPLVNSQAESASEAQYFRFRISDGMFSYNCMCFCTY